MSNYYNFRISVLIISILFTQIKPLLSSDRSSEPGDFYRDSEHPLTRSLGQTKGLSKRLRAILPFVENIKDQITSLKSNSNPLSESEQSSMMEILQCQQCSETSSQFQPSLNHFLQEPCEKIKLTDGYGGASVSLLVQKKTALAVIKTFNKIEEGISELLYSLISIDINPAPRELKMTRVFDAMLCFSGNFSIVFEVASGHNISYFLPKELSKNVIKSCAEYLAFFHVKNYNILRSGMNERQYLQHVSKSFNSLLHNPSKDDERVPELIPLKKGKRGLVLLSLAVGRELSELKEIKSDNIIRLLPKKGQKIFVELVQRCCELFEGNATAIYRLFPNSKPKVPKPYFLTITHGDAHGDNFFYDEDGKLTLNDNLVSEDSARRITMIDFSSIVRTYGNIGDPAEDVGRFVGWLCDWTSRQNYSEQTQYAKFKALQSMFIGSYLKQIYNSGIFSADAYQGFKKTFLENVNFYKFRFFRAVFNSEKDATPEKDKVIKLTILKSWIKENSELEPAKNEKPDQDLHKKKLKKSPRQSKSAYGNDIIYYLPDLPENFIESIPDGSEISYLELLKANSCASQICQGIGTTSTTSRITILTGMGGVGKTTLGVRYAHEALKSGNYNLVYWIASSTDISLLKSYRNLLIELEVSIEKDRYSVTRLVAEHVSRRSNCLLLYDNVPCPEKFLEFLGGNIPHNTEILLTSRRRKGWHELLPNCKVIDLNIFSPPESKKYFYNTTGLNPSHDNEGVALTLAYELGYLPLALSHAAHYIKLVGGNDVTVEILKQYLKDFGKEPEIHFDEHRNLLKEPEPEVNYSNLVDKTVRMSQKFISELAQNILLYAAYLDPDSIAEEIFLECGKDKEKIRDALRILCELSLIKGTQNNAIFSIHRLVQLVVRNETEVKKNQQVKEVFLRIAPPFKKLFVHNINSLKQIEKALGYLPHILELIAHSNRLNIESQEIESVDWIGKILFSIALEKDILKSQSLLGIRKKNFVELCPILKDAKRPASLRTWLKGYYPVLLGVNPTLDSLQLIKKGELGLFCKGDMLYCKVHNREEMKIIKAEGPTTQGLNAESFDRILGATRASGNPDKDDIVHHQKKPRCKELLMDLDIKTLLQYTSLCDYTLSNIPNWLLEIISKQVHPKVQRALGTMYRGIFVIGNHQKSFLWYMKAAKQGDALSQGQIAEMYADGHGVPQDDVKAAEWYMKAAQQGSVVSQYILGMWYAKGRSVPQSDTEAFKWVMMAAKQGDCRAQHKIAEMYAKGRGVDRDDSKSAEWLMKAAEQGDALSQNNLGVYYTKGLGVLQSNVEAFKWFYEAAKQGYVDAQYSIGMRYNKGLGVKQDTAESTKWFTKAAAQGHMGALLMIGMNAVCSLIGTAKS